MPGVSFDRAAAFYDATRGYAPGSAERVRDALVAYVGATPSTRFLEIGVGTGRIALPFIQAGYDYTGVDISEAMMDRLREKLANDPHANTYHYTLLNADATRLPFPDDSFDVLLAVHVLHLVSDRQQVMREAKRVLKPGGMFFSIYDGAEENEDEIPARQVRNKWLEIMQDMRVPRASNGPQWITDEIVQYELEQLGAQVETVKLATYERPPVSAREMAGMIANRCYSSDWANPEDVHAEALRRLEAWMVASYPNPDEPVVLSGDVVAIAGRW